MRRHRPIDSAPHHACGALSFVFACLLLAACFSGCESQTTTTENYGFGMEFKDDPDADQAKVID